MNDNLPLPLVSVIIPCFNYESVVCNAIESIKRQTLTSLECIIVNDGSTDNSESAILSCIQDDKRFRYIHQMNLGVSRARNNGVLNSNGIYLCFLDADDIIEPIFLETCVRVLEAEDNSLGITYTGLKWVLPSGYSRKGDWPGEFNYDKQISLDEKGRSQNQVPTCCVMRRECWERIGGFRSRQNPAGMGTEDAHAWTRIGSIGYNALKVTDDPLFVYSMAGRTRAKDYQEPDFLSEFPWYHDRQHPFASLAKPELISHGVLQYDSPAISVIIPVGPSHEGDVIEALDSLEMQFFRNWEAILVDDTGSPNDCPNCPTSWLDSIKKAYPYLTIYSTPGKMGAGYARNRGAELARAPLLLFLDADDFLKPTCLSKMIDAWNETESIIYTDYEAHRFGVSMEEAEKYHGKGRLLYYQEGSQYAVYNGLSAEYDWIRCHQQPEIPPYVWNLISSLVPKVWHDEIGGFDEIIPSMEDWDYWVRLGMAGKPFTRIAEPLVVYLYHTGTRREKIYELGADIVAYCREKYKEIEKVGCTSCGQKRPTYQVPRREPMDFRRNTSTSNVPVDEEWIKCEYTPGQIGDRSVIGPAAFDLRMKGVNMLPNSNGTFSIDYGYKSQGDVFLVHIADFNLARDFTPVEEFVPPGKVNIATIQGQVAPPPPPPEPKKEIHGMLADILAMGKEEKEAIVETVPKPEVAPDVAPEPTPEVVGPVDMEYELRRQRAQQQPVEEYDSSADLQRIPGLPQSVAEQLGAEGVTVRDIAAMSVEDLQRIRGLGKQRAMLIHAALHPDEEVE